MGGAFGARLAIGRSALRLRRRSRMERRPTHIRVDRRILEKGTHECEPDLYL